MGWFRKMGADAVAYHKETAVGRGDDHPGRALEYYGSRGETPLRWGGAVAARLGLVGEVTEAQYDAAFGPGGFRDPLTGERLVSTRTPGVELVVTFPKATSLLGVIGRAEDMHALLDVDTTAVMGWLEGSMQESGGRRGRVSTATPTTGLAYAVTRHGTSRAGDPAVHDHVLIANVTEMRDDRGGYKALYTALLRDRAEAATMVGRLHSAHLAVQLGYAIEADDGPSGRHRHWRVAGIPEAVCEALSKRSDDIAEYLAEKGYQGYRAANAAARATREVKRHTGVDELLPRWHAELAELGWPVERLAATLDDAHRLGTGIAPGLTIVELEQLTARLMDPEGTFVARGKVFTRTRLVAEVAPLLYGHDPAELDHVLDFILASPLVTPLIGVAGAIEQPYAPTAVLTTEHAIADAIERLVDAPGPQLDPALVLAAIAAKQDEIGAELVEGQYTAVNAVCGSGRAVDVIVGIAGSGKTTALNAASSALEHAGYRVIGTATSGQAARTLGDAAGIEAHTMRSLLWHLDHGTITLDRTSVVILDEAGMTADVDMARLVLAVEAARARLVIVGDDRQLSAVGPAGALHAVLAAHPEIVTTLTENVRQRDPSERDALLELRAGDLDRALGFYAANDRITVGPARTQVLARIVEDWVADTEAGHDTFMLAWRRQSVADLNRIARAIARQRGWLTGPDMTTYTGRSYAVGDTVVTLAPNHRGQLVTSERATVTAVHPDALTVETDAGRSVTLLGDELNADRLDHGYALTVHREQGATSDRTHYLAEGGGRELGYVALSRARDHTRVHAVADDLDHALDDIRTDWARTQHDTWITPTTEPGHDPRHHRDPVVDRAATRRRLTAELNRLHALAPPDVTTDLDATLAQLAALREQREHLAAGTGPYATGRPGRIVRQLQELDTDRRAARAGHTAAKVWQRPQWRKLLATLDKHHAHVTHEHQLHVAPEAHRLDTTITRTNDRAAQLRTEARFNHRWHRDHPEHTARVAQLEQQLADLDQAQPQPALPTRATTGSVHDTLARTRADLDAIDAVLDRLDHWGHPDDHAAEPQAPDLGLGL